MANTMEITDKIRKVLLNLEEITQCQVCLQPLRNDITQCALGHGICIPCRNRTLVCPSCKHRFLNTKPILLVQVLEVLPRFCQFSESGCKEIAFSKTHEELCEYRSFKCPMYVTTMSSQCCPWEGSVKHLRGHMQNKHNSSYVSYNVGGVKKLLHKQFKENWLQREYLHSVDDNLFLVKAFKDRSRQRFIQSVRHIPMRKSEWVYYFVLTMSKMDIVYQHTIKAVRYDQCERIDLSPHCMMVPLEEMGLFLNNNGSLEVTFEVKKKKQ